VEIFYCVTCHNLGPSLTFTMDDGDQYFKKQKIVSKNLHTLLQHVDVVYYSKFTKLMNSLLSKLFPFTKTNEYTQNLMKSLGLQGHLLL
jgi:hypothetical protein